MPDYEQTDLKTAVVIVLGVYHDSPQPWPL